MHAPDQTLSVLSFFGVVIQLGGALMVIGLFLMLRHFVLRRRYFGAWATAWIAFAAAIAALVVRYMIVPGVLGADIAESNPGVRALYFVYQLSKALGFAYFLRGTMLYVAGAAGGVATKRFWAAAAVFALLSSLLARNGLNEMVIWQSVVAAPVLAICGYRLLSLPRPRRTAGSVATGTCFSLLAALWLVYVGAFSLTIGGAGGTLGVVARTMVGLNAYFDLTLNLLLAYSMVLVLMEDNKREIDDAQAELRLTHDQLRRAALYDSLTDSLNRRAFVEGVGLEMMRTTFGTVVIADLDNLKFVNDRHGHGAGDRLIRRCADVLRATLHTHDKLYRWGGDEFLLIVPSARPAEVIARLRDAIDRASVNGGVDGPRLQVSLGAAGYSSFEALAEAIDVADKAMYREKARRKTDGSGQGSGVGSGSPPTPIAAVR
ncbi:MAG TPA: GGDEF domain-containing protein [Gemmatimonadaceae bacterium]|nr:GGDEF domain-containing protein [Gemmatimonadaceae bacterium]